MEENSPTVTLYSDGSYYVGDDTEIDERKEITIYWPNGDKKFVGYLRHGIPVNGRMFFQNMDQYVGEWKDGQFHGQGTYIFCAGRRYDGEFKNGKYHGKGRLTDVGQLIYEGDFYNGVYHGRGRLTNIGQLIYEGGFRDGEYHGEGRLRWDDGRLYIGEFRNGRAHGEGALFAEDGEVEDSGRWVYGALVRSYYP